MNPSLTGGSIPAYRGLHDQESQGRRRGLGGQVRLLPTLEARFARDELEAEELGISYQRVAPNEESGSGRINVDGELHDVGPLGCDRVAGNVVRFWVAGADGLELIAFGTSSGGMDAELVQPDAG